MTRILITGASGFLGWNLTRVLAARNDIYACYLRNPIAADGGEPFFLDITEPMKVRELFAKLKPQLVVHAAAISQPDLCEKSPEVAGAIIVNGTRHVAIACSEIGAKLVHISTDLVFDGKRGRYREEDPVNGISVYASAKIEAEAVAVTMAPDSLILRVAVLYGAGSPAYPGFVDTVMSKWREGCPVTFFTDQYRTPTYAPQVAEVVEAVRLNPGVRGILHFGGADRVSRFEFALLLAERAGADPSFLRQGSMGDVKVAAPRGADCSLVSARIQQALGIRPVGCAEGLDMLMNSGHLSRIQDAQPRAHP